MTSDSVVIPRRALASPSSWVEEKPGVSCAILRSSFGDVRWMKLDITRAVTTGSILDKVDLSKVDEIGFVDLMPGSGHGQGGWVDVAQVEVYGGSVPRTGSSASQ